MPLLKDVEQAVLVFLSCLCDNMHDQMPNKHRQQHHEREIQHYVDLFAHHNAVPVKKNYLTSVRCGGSISYREGGKLSRDGEINKAQHQSNN